MEIDKETYRLVRENNVLLKMLILKLGQLDDNNFPTNVIANIFADKIMNNI